MSTPVEHSTLLSEWVLLLPRSLCSRALLLLFCLQRSVAAGGNASASHYDSRSVHASSYDSVTYSTQHEEAAPVASQEPDPEEDAAVVAATTDEEALQSDDVTLEVAGELHTICHSHSHTSDSI